MEPCLPVQIVVRDSAHVILTSFGMCSACSSLKDMFRDGIPSHHSFSEVFELAVFKKINPSGRVVLAPVCCETIAAIFYCSVLFSSAVFGRSVQEDLAAALPTL